MSKNEAKSKQPIKRKPYKFTAQKRAEYINKLREGGRRHVSARAVGVTPQTVAALMRTDPAFAEAVTWAEMESDDEVEDALRTAAISGNVTACLAWLYSRSTNRWRDTRHLKFDYADVVKEIERLANEKGIDPRSDPVLAAIFTTAGAIVPSAGEIESNPVEATVSQPNSDSSAESHLA